MNNSSNQNDKVWYKSKTIWLLVAQLLLIVASFAKSEISFSAAFALILSNVAGYIIRFYTKTGIRFKD